MEELISALKIEQLITELASNSLFFNSGSIAIHHHASKGRIQIIDNGIGISKGILKNIGETKISLPRSDKFPKSLIFEKIRQNSYSMLITTRTSESPVTYVKVFKTNCIPYITKGVDRPCKGTTISIRGLNWPITETAKCLISYTVAIFALFYPMVSFSIRDDEEQDITVAIRNPHKSDKILEYICNHELPPKTFWYLELNLNPNVEMKAYIGFMKDSSKYAQRIYINFKLVNCPEIENMLSSVLQKVHKIWLPDFPNKNPFFILHIHCPVTEFDWRIYADKINVEFRNREFVGKLKKLVNKNVVGSFRKSACMEKKDCHVNKKVRFAEHLLDTKNKPNYSCFATKEFRYTPFPTRKIIYHHFKQRNFSFIKRRTIERIEQTNFRREISENGTEENGTYTGINIQIEDRHSISTLVVEESIDKSQTLREEHEILRTCSISQWSEWNYTENLQKVTINDTTYFWQQQEVDRLNDNQYYSFLPLKLHNLLKYRNKKMIERYAEFSDVEVRPELKMISDGFPIKTYRTLDPRNLEKTGNIEGLKISKESLRKLRVLRQVNTEFIAALTIQNNKKYLLLIDQHAVDERIRYEQLLEVYRANKKRDEYVSDILKNPITLNDLDQSICFTLSENQKCFKKYGVTFRVDQTRVTVFSVPLCFQSRKYFNDDFRLMTYTRKLLVEVAESLTNANSAMILPSSIHLAIATEACRGAIKFGDPLTKQQCECLLRTLSYTNGFSRCAHGRPSIIPLLDLTDLKTETKSSLKPLNYASLSRKRRHR